MTKTEQLVQRAARIAHARATAISGWRADIRDLEQRKARIEREIDEATSVEKRLVTYREAAQAASDEDPICPDCWMDRAQELAMMPITSDTPNEIQYGCMECGFEASFPAQTVRSQPIGARSARQAA
jgi:DNA-directed RNA polymerase subunit M/transcription elongation factor TFIIS